MYHAYIGQCCLVFYASSSFLPWQIGSPATQPYNLRRGTMPLLLPKASGSLFSLMQSESSSIKDQLRQVRSNGPQKLNRPHPPTKWNTEPKGVGAVRDAFTKCDHFWGGKRAPMYPPAPCAPNLFRCWCCSRFLLDVADGAMHMHGMGLIHKDINPGNVLIFKDEILGHHAKLADFGITKGEPLTIRRGTCTSPLSVRSASSCLLVPH